MNIVPYLTDHVDYIIKERTNDENPEDYKRYFGFGNGLDQPGMAYTAFDNGHVICSAGIKKLWFGVGEAWIVSSWRIREKPIGVIKAIRARFDDIIETNELHRVQAAVRADWDEAVRFAEYLDFKNEGLMRGYGVDGRDYFRYARVS